MWDNPRVLNTMADALLALVAAAILYLGLQLLLRSPLFPLREVVVHGTLKQALRADIERAIGPIDGNFFAADLAAVRARLEQVAWVRRVEARRIWPDRIEVRLEEHVALARWGDAGLVNTFGEPFAARIGELEAPLPLFGGPPGGEDEVARRYRRFVELLAPLGEVPVSVTLTARHAWRLRLASGLHLELGRDGADAVEQRLARFAAAYPDALGRLGLRGAAGMLHVDLRYPNGFALRVAGGNG